MKNKTVYLLFFLLVAVGINAQTMGFAPKKNDDKNLTHEQKKEVFKNYKEDMLIKELKLETETQKANFKRVYAECQDMQRKVKGQFDNKFNPEDLTATEAKQKLEESFLVGQKFLDNKKECAKKMETVISPQQVLKMFQVEGKVRDKVLLELHKGDDKKPMPYGRK